MKQQNFKNYPRVFPFGPVATFIILIAGLFLAVINVFKSRQENLLLQIVIVVIFVVLGSLYYYSRLVALRAQNRAILAGENLRHTLLTGKALDKRLQLNQIMALRLASDEELAVLASEAAENNLTASEIKEQIKMGNNTNNINKMR